jgi:hypothetical protein
MPPTAGFGRGPNAAPEADEFEQLAQEFDAPVAEDAESILEECVEFGLPSEMLSWHYRSRDEVLIAFSNRHYYEGRLSSFPAPVTRRPDLGIEYRRVDGQFHHGSTAGGGRAKAELQTNPIEAEAIIEEVRRRVHHPDLSAYSLGIVTLNVQQRRLIERRLEELKDPVITELLETDDTDRRLIVRNLEAVQGQERDVILLGTSFSRLEGGGAMPLRFGPLNLPRGERRLNVAITRARRQVVIFSSFDPEELSHAKAIGLQHLRDYLLRARSSAQSDEGAGPDRTDVEVDLQVSEVAGALRARGLIVTESYGLSSFKVDLAVTTPEHPERWLVGVLLDGRGWGRRTLALDRDALPVTVLRGLMGWPRIARVWLPAWMNSHGEVLDAIEDQVRVVAKDPDAASGIVRPTPRATTMADAPDPLADASAATTSSPPPRPELARTDSQEAPASARVRSYVTWEFSGSIGSPDAMERAGSIVRSRLESIAATEGPVLLDQALRAVARTFGLNRARESRLEALRRSAPTELLVTTPFGVHLFAPDQLTATGAVDPAFDWYRRTNFRERNIEVISPHEVMNAATDLAQFAHGIVEDELASELLVTFGYARRTADTIAYVRRIVSWGTEFGRLRRDGDLLHPAS